MFFLVNYSLNYEKSQQSVRLKAIYPVKLMANYEIREGVVRIVFSMHQSFWPFRTEFVMYVCFDKLITQIHNIRLDDSLNYF